MTTALIRSGPPGNPSGPGGKLLDLHRHPDDAPALPGQSHGYAAAWDVTYPTTRRTSSAKLS